MKKVVLIGACAAVVWLAGCGAGPYNYARTYKPNMAEKPLLKVADTPNYSELTLRTEEWKGQLITWFGVVLSVEPAQGGKHLVRLAHVLHQERHLCKDEGSRTCRVTVSDARTGEFSALLDIKASDLEPGLDKLQPGSLLRVYGKLRCGVDPEKGLACERDSNDMVLLEGVAYRHFPPRHYVTPRRATEMRR
jgi:hypothetical protein